MGKTKFHKASVLIVTLIIMGIVLVTALSASLVSIKQRQSSLGAGKSDLAFQNADTGVEQVLNDIKNNASGTVSDLSNCISGKIVGSGYSVELRKADGTVVDCTTQGSTVLSDITSIKSVGTGNNQETRAIEAAVASTGPAWDSDWFSVNNSSNQTITKAHNLGVYPTNCMAWFSPDNPPSGKIFPLPCYNSPYETSGSHAYQNPLGWAIDTTNIKLYIWNGTNLFNYWDTSNWNRYNNGYIRIFLWK